MVEDADRLRERLRLTNAEHERLTSIADAWWRVSPTAGDHAARVLLYHLGAEKFTDRALVAWSRSPAGVADRAWRDFAKLPARWTAPVFPLRAADFMARGIARGPALGAAMRAAEEAWIAADFPDDPAAWRVSSKRCLPQRRSEIWSEVPPSSLRKRASVLCMQCSLLSLSSGGRGPGEGVSELM